MAVAQEVEQVGRSWFKSPAPKAACRNILEQQTEPQMAPDEQLAVGMAISVWMCVWMGEYEKCKAVLAVTRQEKNYWNAQKLKFVPSVFEVVLPSLSNCA